MAAFEEIHGSGNKRFTAREFIDYLRYSRLIWSKKATAVDALGHAGTLGTKWFFRGQWDARWNLLPAAWRAIEPQYETERPNVLLTLIAQFLKKPIDKPEHPKQHEACAWEAAMIEGIMSFHALARELGLPATAIRWQHWPMQYDELSKGYGSGTLVTDGPWPFGYYSMDADGTERTFALAQHHGIPTHLLDWTEDPMIACHFAASPDKEFEGKTDIAVWAIRQPSLEEGVSIAEQLNSACYQFAFPPTYESRYIQSQRAVLLRFSLHGYPFFKCHGRWPSVEEILQTLSLPTPVLRKLVLDKAEYQELRALLDLERITFAHLMPTLDNVARTVKHRW